MKLDSVYHPAEYNPLKDYFSISRILKTLPLLLIFNTLIAAFLTLTRVEGSFVVSLIMSQSYGISIFFLIVLLFRIFNPERKIWAIIPICIIGTIGGYFSGGHIGPFIIERLFSISIDIDHQIFTTRNVVFVVTFSGIACYFFYTIAYFKVSAELIQKERINRLSSEKEALEANLRLLQAQIEPHFLFNTLSNILSLIDTDPSKGKSMLSDLIQYLRTSLSRTRPAITTLDQEMNMIRSYLDIQKVRMSGRLSFTIDLPDDLKQLPFPPMLLQPLVENAVEHGLSPRLDGGEITVKAMRIDNGVRIEVNDTGNGFSVMKQAGVGIANVRERIRLLYGDKGLLTIEENTPHGVRAIIEVPKDDL